MDRAWCRLAACDARRQFAGHRPPAAVRRSLIGRRMPSAFVRRVSFRRATAFTPVCAPACIPERANALATTALATTARLPLLALGARRLRSRWGVTHERRLAGVRRRRGAHALHHARPDHAGERDAARGGVDVRHRRRVRRLGDAGQPGRDRRRALRHDARSCRCSRSTPRRASSSGSFDPNNGQPPASRIRHRGVVVTGDRVLFNYRNRLYALDRETGTHDHRASATAAGWTCAPDSAARWKGSR